MRYFLIISIFWSVISFSQTQNSSTLLYQNYSYKDSIKTVLLHRKGWELSYPALNLNATEQLQLSFDEIGTETKDYYYKLIHCTYDWKPSDLMSMEYITGMQTNPVTEYKYSFNTIVEYTHYIVNFPTNDMQITKSGNYIILIFEDADEENIVLTKRFFVYDQLTTINVKVERSSRINLIKTHQEVNFTINASQLPLNDAYTEIKPVILQNGFWNTASYNFQPNMVRDKEIIYNFKEKCIFAGGNEYRYFDAKDLKYQTQNVKQIIFESPFYHFTLHDDLQRRFKVYLSDEDINGKRLIKANYRNDSSTEADYIHAYFSLPMNAPVVNGDIYVFGQLSDGQYGKLNKMIYSYKQKAYRLRLMLKQGYYNYQYILIDKEYPKGDVSFVEGSHLQTENDYIILVYFHSFTSSYDRLVGYSVVNSVAKN